MSASAPTTETLAILTPRQRQWRTLWRLLSFLWLLAGMVVFAWGAWSLWVDLQKKAPLAVVHIEGDINQVDREDLAKRLKTVVHGSYFSTDLVAIRDAVLLSPWVESLSVQRRWPDGIRVTIVEKKAVARWGEQRFFKCERRNFSTKSG
jgi:cell division protein FtsQ